MYRPVNRININQENSETVCENRLNMLDTAAIVNRKLVFDPNLEWIYCIIYDHEKHHRADL